MFKLNDIIKDCEKLFEDKEKYEGLNGKDIYQRLKIDKEIDLLLITIKKNIDKLKKKFGKDKEKEQKIILINRNYELLYNKYNNIEIKPKKKIISLEEFMKSNDKKDPGSVDVLREDVNNISQESERPIYAEEEVIIGEFKMRVEKQNVMIDDLQNAVTGLKAQAKEIGDQIKGINIPVKKIIPKAVIVINNIESKNKRLTDLIKKIRSPCDLFCDILLIVILFGLICVLISIIKHKYC